VTLARKGSVVPFPSTTIVFSVEWKIFPAPSRLSLFVTAPDDATVWLNHVSE
jgi:hypothetical protein